MDFLFGYCTRFVYTPGMTIIGIEKRVLNSDGKENS